ncbi:MAG TPA: FmdE family protein [Methanocorpusculum sp.]|nr:formylmethanofuran dehydrogenase [Candidatus Methanocorpusculum equi]MCQ2357474.1 FmdE family protein [Methanocorpusculum sp.]HJJ32990.1 FmdE family protein [Methanocorpusculum sp.]HJJ44285.1 FmdE family protein [Methanocorpusculum sp.]HJJ59023.1 FmdE family protein [Methanocorpusculum sp.]
MKSFEDAAAFHGHVCGGLAIGYKAALYAAELLDLSFSPDEEVVCITETDSCAVDAIQTVLGCTAGKGNLIVHRWGKSAFSFYQRDTGRSLRLVLRPDAGEQSDEMKALRARVFSGAASDEERRRYQTLRQQQVEDILRMPPEALFIVKETELPLPAPAVMQDSAVCSVCGEQAAKGFCSVVEGKYVCRPCAERMKLNLRN